MAKNLKLKISAKALQDMENIFKYISVDLANPSASDKLMQDMRNCLNTVCEFPESCPKVNNEYFKDKTLRKLIVSNYIIFYKILEEEQVLLAVRVLYGMQNFSDIL